MNRLEEIHWSKEDAGQDPKILITDPMNARGIFRLNFPIYKRIWRLLMLIIKGWCYYD